MTAVPARLSVDTELRHGYTLAQVRALSIVAVRRDSWHQAADFDERLEVAWHAIVEHVYTAPEPPRVREVIQAGWRAIGDHVDRGQRFYGRDTNDRYAGTTAGFERYWWAAARATSGPEEPVTERVALAQIWPLLRPLHRQVLAALAAHDDYGLAAEALGKSRSTFTTQVGQARQAFLRLWHQGERPSKPWGTDRRLSVPRRHSVTHRAIVERQRSRARRAARNGGQLPAVRRSGKAPSDLGISGAELAGRYQDGESIRQLAASLGRSYSVIQRRLHAAGIQPQPGRPGAPGSGQRRN